MSDGDGGDDGSDDVGDGGCDIIEDMNGILRLSMANTGTKRYHHHLHLDTITSPSLPPQY